MKLKRFIFTLGTVLFLIFPQYVLPQESVPQQEENIQVEQPFELPAEKVAEIDSFIEQRMQEGKIPGLAIAIVKGNQTVYQKGFGFANLEKKIPVTPETVFELGSTSKAFTGLAILQLEQDGKLQFSDRVSTFLPWFKMKRKGQETPITIANLIYHTSGIPYYKALSEIPPDDSDQALEEAVRQIAELELTFQPGQQFTYSTVNYAILGLIVQTLSGQPYESYMKEKVFLPMGLTHTTLFRQEAMKNGLATGYKIYFGKQKAYDAPMYRGNAPAGYIMTNITDYARFLKIQMGMMDIPGIHQELIEKSHAPHGHYSVGWMHRSDTVWHGGANPNYSSFIQFNGDKLGVVVLANTVSRGTSNIGLGVTAIISGYSPNPLRRDMNESFDRLSTKIIMIAGALALLGLLLLILSILKILRRKRALTLKGVARKTGLIISTLVFGILCLGLYRLPQLLNFDVNWSFGAVWMPASFIQAALCIFLFLVVYYLWILSKLLFSGKREADAL